MPRTAATALLVAAAYWLAGRLGLLLALPPGYATAVWPPSGLALAAVLLGGARLAPGIWLGSFCLNLATGFSPEHLLVGLGVPALIALGAALQAVLGGWLIRRGGYEINLLASGQGVMQLLLLGGPVACLVNSTVGVTSLWATGKVPLESVPFNWWTWWIGDSIGVLLFTPLVLVWAARPYRTWLRRQVFVTTPLVLLFAVVVLVFMFITRREQARIENEFEALAQDVHQTLQVRLRGTLDVLSSVEGFYASSQRVEPYEFEIFASRLIAHIEGVTALSWNPVVPDAERAAFEARVRRSGHEDFHIVEGVPGERRPAARRDLYVPIETIAPRAGNEAALGFDTASDPVRRSAMDRARDTGEPVVSRRVELIQNGEPGLLVLLPVYRHGAQAYSPEDRRRYLQGFAVAVFKLSGMIGDANARATARGLGLRLRDVSPPGAPELIYGNAVAPVASLNRVFDFSFAGREWRLEMSLPEQALVQRRSWAAWFVLAGGLVLTGLLGILLLIGVGRTAYIEALVAERTEKLRRTAAQLAHSNRELEQFAYVTSHDLKAPLRTIASFAELLGRRYAGKLEGEGKEFLDFIVGGVRQMQDLIDDLLQLSRVEARKLEIVALPMRVAVERACGALAADLEAARAKLHIGELPEVQGDRNMLTQLWQNLIANGAKFHRRGQAPNIWISARKRATDWQFSVRDDGIGIDPAHLDQIFLVFRRLHTQEEYAGTGIGLAICKKVVNLHGGEIWAESKPGEGTTFHFTLPYRIPATNPD